MGYLTRQDTQGAGITEEAETGGTDTRSVKFRPPAVPPATVWLCGNLCHSCQTAIQWAWPKLCRTFNNICGGVTEHTLSQLIFDRT